MLGGAILNTGTIGEISESKFSGESRDYCRRAWPTAEGLPTGGELTIINTDFLNNYANRRRVRR